MRCPENKIKAAILHAEREVRDYALRYFSDAYSRDPSIMPLVIESVARHGRTDSFAILRSAEDLTQTPATMDWLLHELDQDYDHGDVQLENYYCALALILCHADPHLLAPFRDRLLAMPSFPAELHEDLLLQIRRADWDWPTGWKAFQECGLRVLGGWWGDWDLQQADAIVRALGQFRADGESTVLQLLNGDFRGHDQRLMQWLEPHLVALAGAMKLEAAIPLLVQRLASDKLDVMDAVGGALANIGTEEAVRAVTKYWTDVDENDRCGGEEVFEHIRCDLSLRTALDFLAREKNLEVACSLAHAALAQFDDDAIEPVRRFLLEHADDEAFAPDFAYLRWRFLVVAIVTGSSLPEYAAWCAEASDNNWGRGDPLDFRLVDHCGPDRDPDDFLDDEEDWPDAEILGEEYPPDEEYSSEKLEPRLEPIVNKEAKIGRNDPCPCGSGKKYKKCCVNKGNA